MIQFLLFLLVSSLAVCAWASPAISVKPDTFDFKACNEGDTVHAAFQVKNTGKSPLIIKRIRSDCGCTVPEMARDTLPPGDSCKLSASFDSHNYPGMAKKTIFISSNDPAQKVARVYMTGNVISHLKINHHKIYFRNSPDFKGELKRKIIVTNIADKPFNITAVELSRPDFTAEPESTKLPYKLPPHKTFAVTVAPSSSLRRSHNKSKAVLKIQTDSPINNAFEVPLSYFYSKITKQDNKK